MLGAEKQQTTVWKNDSAELYANFYDSKDNPLEQDQYSSVEFTVRDPEGHDTTSAGTVNSDGSCYYRFDGTAIPGLYKWIIQATLTTGEKRTYRDEFYVEDPLASPPQGEASEITSEVWMRLEDCFDSELGGPWLRDMSLVYFEPNKIERFIPEALLRINAYPPATHLTIVDFTTVPNPELSDVNPDQIILVQGTLLAIIRHLMRAYTEQPAPQGANIVWQDRRDYLQRWQSIYQIEDAAFKEMILLWKRQFYNFGHGALLTHSKAGRLYPTGWRARNSTRGYT